MNHRTDAQSSGDLSPCSTPLNNDLSTTGKPSVSGRFSRSTSRRSECLYLPVWMIGTLLVLISPLALTAGFSPVEITSQWWDDYPMFCGITVRGLLPDGILATVRLDGETTQHDPDRWDFRMSVAIPTANPSIYAAREFGDWAAALLQGEEFMMRLAVDGALAYEPWVWEELANACGKQPACADRAPRVKALIPGEGTLGLALALAEGTPARVELDRDGGWFVNRVVGEFSACEARQLGRFTDYVLAVLNGGCVVNPVYTSPEEMRLADTIFKVENVCQDHL